MMTGEVFVRSDAVANGYFALPPGGACPFRDGGCYMGDLGVLDDDGFLEVRGRRDEIINVTTETRILAHCRGMRVGKEPMIETRVSHSTPPGR